LFCTGEGDGEADGEADGGEAKGEADGDEAAGHGGAASITDVIRASLIVPATYHPSISSCCFSFASAAGCCAAWTTVAARILRLFCTEPVPGGGGSRRRKEELEEDDDEVEEEGREENEGKEECAKAANGEVKVMTGSAGGAGGPGGGGGGGGGGGEEGSAGVEEGEDDEGRAALLRVRCLCVADIVSGYMTAYDDLCCLCLCEGCLHRRPCVRRQPSSHALVLLTSSSCLHRVLLISNVDCS
jgi:hypothetical protein